LRLSAPILPRTTRRANNPAASYRRNTSSSNKRPGSEIITKRLHTPSPGRTQRTPQKISAPRKSERNAEISKSAFPLRVFPSSLRYLRVFAAILVFHRHFSQNPMVEILSAQLTVSSENR
jgi:hypothetical protein